MDASQINRMLYQHFVNYDYRLHNSFIYNWESDFFAVSGSGYKVEVEVKVSRGDFFRDFSKDKHQLFEALAAKKTHYFSHRPGKGDEVCRYRYGFLTEYDDGVTASDLRSRWSVVHNGKRGYWVNDCDWVRISKRTEIVYAPATLIQFHETADRLCPNQLYFACPENLIKLEEVPAYAGLFYCGKDGIYQVRRAPYLHKVKQNLTNVLLQKFYNLWQYKTDLDKKMEITGQYNLFNK